MRAITQDTYGGPELMALSEVEPSEIGSGQVLIDVRAAGLSPGDRAMLTGLPYVNRLAASGIQRRKRRSRASTSPVWSRRRVMR